jgi:CBS domain-containing protein
MTVEYHRRGRSIIARGKDNHSLYVLRSGAVDIRDDQGMLVDRAEAGDVFGSITLVLGNPSTFEVAAIEDTLVYVLPGADFHALTGAHPDFAHFFDEQRTHRMRGAVATLQDSGSTMLRTSVRDLITRAPITIAQGATITEAARTMKEHGASSLLVMDGEALAGIVTDRDLRNRVLAVGLGADRPVQEVMTAGPVVGDADALAFEVLLEMVGRNIHHLPILEHDLPIGVVTTTDLMRMVQASPVYVVGDIQKQSGRRRRRHGSVPACPPSSRPSSRRTPAPTTSAGSSPRSVTPSSGGSSPSPRPSWAVPPACPTPGWPWAPGPASSRPSPPTRTTRSSSATTRPRADLAWFDASSRGG